MVYDFDLCEWWKEFPRHRSKLGKFLRDRAFSLGAVSYWCDKGKQYATVEYIQCVRLSEIEKKEPWAKERSKRIDKWADPDSLRRVKIFENEDMEQVLGKFIDLPVVSRYVNLKKTKQEKFEIGDGIHRINKARELGIDCILAQVSETVEIKEEDKDVMEGSDSVFEE